MFDNPSIPIFDHGYVRLVEKWGSDRSFVEAARMSTDKGFLGWEPEVEYKCSRCGYILIVHELGDQHFKCGNIGCSNNELTYTLVHRGDTQLLKYLYEHRHMTPFEMGGLTLEIQAPIFVFREWQRHRVPFGYNEMSGRYTELPQLCYVPSDERIAHARQSKGNKQGSQAFEENEVRVAQDLVTAAFKETYDTAWKHYLNMLDHGVARELASRVLPTAQYSRMRVTANVRGWLGFLTLRMDPTAQYEIREYANIVGDLVANNFPRTWILFNAAGPLIEDGIRKVR